MNRLRTTGLIIILLLGLQGLSGCGHNIFRHSSHTSPVTQSNLYQVSDSYDIQRTADSEPDSVLLAQEEAINIASKSVSEDILHTFLSADSVNCFRLMYADSVSGTFQVEPNFVRVTDPVLLDNDEILTILNYLLLCPDAYVRCEFRIEARYFPFWEFEFVHDGMPTASLLVSPADRTWSIASEGSRLTNFDIPFPDRTISFCESKLSSSAEPI